MKRLSLLTLFFLLATLARAQDNVTVDFSSDQGEVNYEASGFLHGMNSSTPSSADVNPMQGRLFRGDDTDNMLNASNYARYIAQGGVPMYILGDAWIDNYGGYNPTNARIVTSATMSNWNAMVTSLINSAIGNGQTFQWDIWNEPDINVFWTGTEAQYQAAWQSAVNTIRGISAGQIIVGPSTCCQPWASWATDLMAFAKANNVLPNIVAVHENTSPSQLESDVATIKAYLAANDPGITLVDTPEMVDQSDTYNAGTNLQFLAAVEHAGVNAAAHSCWNSDCFDNSIDGLTNNGLIADWYAYQAYANITGRLVGVTPTANVDGVAGSDSTLHQAYSVFGRNATSATINVTYNNIPSYLVAGGKTHVNGFVITNDNGSGSSGPTQTINSDYTVSGNSITVSFPSVASQAVPIVQLTPAASGGCNTYYVDYVTGNDSNSGCSTSLPWKHAPGMKGLTPSGGSTGDGCTATCASASITAGTSIIMKGGTVWPYTTAPWTFSSNGASSTSLYGCQGSGCIYIGNAVGAGLSPWNSGTVTSITLKRDFGGWNPASPPTISCSGGGGSNAAATPLVVPAANTDPNIAGFIYHITLTSGGSSYTLAPSCTIVGGSGTATLQTDIDRAIFDLGNGSSIDWPAGQCGTYPTVCFPEYTVSGSYVITSGLEVRNVRVQQPVYGGSNDEGSSMMTLGSHDTASNNYLHGMFVDCVFSGSCSTYDVASYAIYPGGSYSEVANNIIENGDAGFLGTSSQAANGICTTNSFCTTFEFGIDTGTQAGFGPVSSHGNVSWMNAWQLRFSGNDATGSDPYLEYGDEFWLTSYLVNPTAHINARYSILYSPSTLISWNNIVHNQVAGTSSQSGCSTGQSYYAYNEVIWQIGTGTLPYSIGNGGDSGGCTWYLYNDTMYSNNTASCVNSVSVATASTVTMQNLHCIMATAANPFWSTSTNFTYQNYAGSSVVANVQAASVVQSLSTANGQGYTATNAFAPTSNGNSTVTFASGGGSANLTSLCTGYFVSLCYDILGNHRPNSGFQAGAYDLSGTTPTAGTPSCSPGTGTYNTTQSVTCSVSGGAPILCYTTDGSTPSTNGVSACSHGTLYSGALSVVSSLTLKVIAGGSGFLDGSVATYNYTILGPAGTPSCSPGSGTYGSTQSVTCSVAGGAPVLCYTINGATPSTNGTTGCTTGTHYTVEISVASSLTLKVIAGGTGYTDGPVATYTYTITVAAGTPSCTPGSGSYASTQSVTCSVSGGAPILCYTVDGSTPSTNGVSACSHGTLYSGALSVVSSLTLKAIAGGTGYADGSVATYTYTISGIAGTPSCSPGTGTYSATQSVTCTVAGGAPVLCYTTNSSTPATNGTSGCTTGMLVAGAITISSTTTLKVIAGGTGYTDGGIVIYTYTITSNPGSPGAPCAACIAGIPMDVKAEAF